MFDYLQDLKNKCKDFYLYVSPVLEDSRFSTWSGAGSDIHHHYGDGGLLLHTYEVYRYAELIACEHNSTCRSLESRINPQELFISAIWHDFGMIMVRFGIIKKMKMVCGVNTINMLVEYIIFQDQLLNGKSM